MSKTYKIAIDARRLRATTGRYTRQMLKYLQKIDNVNEYHVIVHEDDLGAWAPEAPNFKIHIVKQDFYTFGEQLGFAMFLYKLNPDLVHFTMPQQPLLYFGRKVTTIHDLTLVRFKNITTNKWVYALKQLIFKILIHWVSRTSKFIITPTKYIEKDLLEYTGIDRAKVSVTLESGEELTKIESQSMKKFKDKDFIMYVGNAFPHKNLQRLIDAHQLLLVKNPNLHLILVGKHDYFWNLVKEHVKDTKAKNVHLTGFVSDENLTWLYQNSRAYVFPSLSEGFGLPGLEAMQYGLPVVSSEATCLPEVYGEGAHYFDALDIKDMARAISDVITDEKLRDKLIKNGNVQIKKYSWEKMSQETHKIYMKAVL